MAAARSDVARLSGHTFLGVDPSTFEPMFERSTGGPLLAFDDLPVQARTLVAFGALVVRALHGAWPRADAREAEGVVLVDDAELHLDAAARRGLVPALREALPNVQWIITTASADIASACDAGEVLALKRLEGSAQVELYEGELAVVH
jgi:predicted ATP-binding protein involved in virulence